MPEFNDHQRRLWTEMLVFIDEYRDGKIGFGELVGKLEGAKDAGELNNPELIGQWYDYWAPLETARATLGSDPVRSEVILPVENMKNFIQDVLG